MLSMPFRFAVFALCLSCVWSKLGEDLGGLWAKVVPAGQERMTEIELQKLDPKFMHHHWAILCNMWQIHCHSKNEGLTKKQFEWLYPIISENPDDPNRGLTRWPDPEELADFKS